MMRRLPIARLVWDDWNSENIAKHGVRIDEVHEVVAQETLIKESYKQRLVLIGPTREGRMLAIVVGLVPDQSATYYVFSARPASRREREQFLAGARTSR